MLAPQPSSPSLQREVPQPPMTKTGAWNELQIRIRFLGPILQMGPQRDREESAACLRSRRWYVFLRTTPGVPGSEILCPIARERETWLVPLSASLKTFSKGTLSRTLMTCMG